MTIDYDSDNNKLTDKGPFKNIFYIFIINFCCSLYSKLPGKKLIHFHSKITMYIGINQLLVSVYVVIKIEAISYCFCFDKSFLCIYVNIFLWYITNLNVYYITFHSQGKLIIQYYIVFHYIYNIQYTLHYYTALYYMCLQ